MLLYNVETVIVEAKTTYEDWSAIVIMVPVDAEVNFRYVDQVEICCSCTQVIELFNLLIR